MANRHPEYSWMALMLNIFSCCQPMGVVISLDVYFRKYGHGTLKLVLPDRQLPEGRGGGLVIMNTQCSIVWLNQTGRGFFCLYKLTIKEAICNRLPKSSTLSGNLFSFSTIHCSSTRQCKPVFLFFSNTNVKKNDLASESAPYEKQIYVITFTSMSASDPLSTFSRDSRWSMCLALSNFSLVSSLHLILPTRTHCFSCFSLYLLYHQFFPLC